MFLVIYKLIQSVSIVVLFTITLALSGCSASLQPKKMGAQERDASFSGNDTGEDFLQQKDDKEDQHSSQEELEKNRESSIYRQVPNSKYSVGTRPGSIKVRRKGKTYDIQMDFVTDDDNIIFQMVIPEEQEQEEVVKKGSPKRSEKRQDKRKPVSALDEDALDEFDLEEEIEKIDDEIEEIEDLNRPSPSQVIDRKKFNRLMNQSGKHLLYAQKNFYEDDYESALNEVNESIYYTPQSAIAHALKGSIFYKIRDYKNAIVSWKKALKIDPTLDDVRESLRKLKNR